MKRSILSTAIAALMPLGGYAFASMSGYTPGSYRSQRVQSVDVLRGHTATSVKERKVELHSEEQLGLLSLNPVSELVVIDGSINDKHVIYSSLKPGQEAIEIRVDQDGLAQLTQQLKKYQNLTALHIFSHAESGALQLGNSRVGTTQLADEVSLFNAINRSLKPGADIHFYGCDLAAGAQGEAFLDIVKSKTHADIAASNDLSGNADKGGDWELEIQRGDIDAERQFSALALKDFSDVLVVITGGTSNYNGAYNGASTIDATYNYGGRTFTFNGADVSTSINGGYVYAGAAVGPTYESSLAISIDSGTFDVSSFLWGGDDNMQLSITSDQGDSLSHTTSSTSETINLTGFTGISTLTISYVSHPSFPGFVANLKDFSISNLVTNNAPTVAGLPSDVTVTEDIASNVDLSAATFADADGDSLTVTLDASAGALAATTSGGVTVGGSGTAQLTLAGTASAINTYLDTVSNIKYTGASNANGNDAATIQVKANDGTVNPLLGTVNVDITAQNDDPTVSGLPTDVTVTEDTLSNVNLSAATFADVDSSSITVTLTASAGTFATPADGAAVGSGVTETLVSSTVITLVGAPADINTYLDTASNIQYTGANNVNGNDAATITVTANDGDGSGDVSLGTVNLDITAQNDDPSVSGLPTDVTVTEDTQSNVDLSATTFADVDSASITVTLTASAGTFATPADGAAVGSGVTEALVSSTVITLVGAPADINTYLDTASNIQYTGANNVNGNDAATITVTANDGDGSGDVSLGTVNLDITAQNDDPTVSGLPTDVTVTEDTQSNVDLSATTFADVDSASITVTLTASAGTFATPADGAAVGSGVTETLVSTTVITLAGAPADINTYLDTASNIQYTGANNVSGNDAATITVTANDGDGSGDVSLGTVNLDITAQNDDPTASGLPTDVTVTEDTQSNVDLSATTFADVDSASITVTLTASAGTFATPADGAAVGSGVTETLVSSTVITLAGAPADINTYLDTASNIQYTGANNVSGNDAATITVTANDGDGSGDVSLGTVNLDITAVNDGPTDITISAASIDQSNTGTDVVVGSLSTVDVDSVSFTYALVVSGTVTDAGSCSSDADNASFNVSGSNFRTASALAANTYEVCLRTSDGSLTYKETLSITVNDDVAPRIQSITRQSPTTSPTNSDTLTWDVTFDEAVANVDATDFTVSGTTATIGAVTNPSGNTYRVPVSGGDLADLNATVTLSFAGGQNITDTTGNALSNTTPTGTNNNTFEVQNNNTGQVSVSGDTVVGQTLTANVTDADGISGAITYQWMSGASNVGTNSNTYTLQASDEGNTVTVNAVYQDDLTNDEDVTSSPTATVISVQQNALNTISGNVGGGGTTPTADDYSDAGVTGVTTAQILTLINSAIIRQGSSADVDTTAEIQALVDAILEGQDGDGDGLPNLFEGDASVDTDGDGTADRDDNDADSDGIADLIEIRISGDSDNDGILDAFDADVGNDHTVDAGKTDANFDGVNDDIDTLADLLGFLTNDMDGDTIPDTADADADGDSVTDDGLTDTSPADGIVDGQEDFVAVIQAFFVMDKDRDGVLNFLDLDSDNDTLSDVIEAGLTDADENALADAGASVITDEGALPNVDADADPDFIDVDSDGVSFDILTGSYSTQAGTLDANNDGQLDDNTDTDGDGLADSIDALNGFGNDRDSDGDGIPDSLDPDDDNDGVIDSEDIRTAMSPDVKEASSGISANGLLTLAGLMSILLLRARRVLVAVAALIFAGSSWSAENIVEIQVGLGQATFDPTVEAPVKFEEDTKANFALGVGYRFHPNLMAQLRYSDLGQLDVNSKQYIEYSSTSLNLQAELSVLENVPLKVFGLLGVAQFEQDGTGLFVEDESVTETHLGVGLKLQEHKMNWGFELGSYNEDSGYWMFVTGIEL